ncbi:alpha/beta fold hydrolase [Microbulbifer sp. OS29]|uniref:Alpha/beta fold hydrolase n=1 Tax=Microbulbifer okhotskensis TaxID=2926617 RepID=A0A9X2J4M5_9GAMM|nr:alpha/beta fold hydrolase [Microbulbifer okhotskensis]MCO1333494.1 alpha/beta fold hydrolase [Microbulbifer okhotskensis]
MIGISIQMLGELQVFQGGIPVNLPPSKRTRALLAFLTLAARPHRRDRLCEIFWGLPDDPRASLRWSLSKIRSIVNCADQERLVADRERVSLDTEAVNIDISQIASRVDIPSISVTELKGIHRQLREPFLDGIDLPNQELFQQWLVSEREEVLRLRGRALAGLSSHSDVPLQDRVGWARSWGELEPYSTAAATRLLKLLDLMGLSREMELECSKLSCRFRKAGISWVPYKSGEEEQFDERKDEPILGRTLLTQQKVKFCTAMDGVGIAYASIGKGPPIVKAANWLSHLEYDWDSPIWSPLFRELSLDHQFIRYDERGNGLSDWSVKNISFESFVTDLETVVDACGAENFTLLGISQGAAVSIEYAVRHPERVKQLVLFGGYASGWRIGASEAVIKEREAIMTLTETGWGQDNPAYRQIFSSTFMPSANAAELAWFNEFQRLTTSPENAVRFLSVFGGIDVRERLKQVTVPTLVIHSLGDQRIPVTTGYDIASAIPNARFVGLESDGHLLLGRESASKIFVDEVRRFISP